MTIDKKEHFFKCLIAMGEILPFGPDRPLSKITLELYWKMFGSLHENFEEVIHGACMTLTKFPTVAELNSLARGVGKGNEKSIAQEMSNNIRYAIGHFGYHEEGQKKAAEFLGPIVWKVISDFRPWSSWSDFDNEESLSMELTRVRSVLESRVSSPDFKKSNLPRPMLPPAEQKNNQQITGATSKQDEPKKEEPRSTGICKINWEDITNPVKKSDKEN